MTRLLVQAIPNSNRVKLYTSDHHIPATIVVVESSLELFAEFRMYKVEVIKRGVQLDVVMPNLYAAFVESRVIPPPPPPPAPRPEDTFEVNMMEALVGWKSWSLNLTDTINTTTNSLLLRTKDNFIWKPGEAVEAKCRNCKVSPSGSGDDRCGCGIYAADKMSVANGYGNVMGQVYGWGRYVRGDAGWRAQFAYPKSFLLKEEQADLIDILKPYHVPIYVSQPMKIYSPIEDGYEEEEDGNWKEKEDRGSGASEESASEED